MARIIDTCGDLPTSQAESSRPLYHLQGAGDTSTCIVSARLQHAQLVYIIATNVGVFIIIIMYA